MKREYKDYLNDIYDSIEKIEKFTEHMKFAQFEKDDRTVLAVVKAFEKIASRQSSILTVPWGQI
ncbi:MAG TPA: hypothetical protein ENI34_04350 [candidate division WOR-3 bacterium]|uniref:DUF86 domain-containing protein n=1 Tax=candidate division WOR-3 bacterium TaxID=2052148 RepID=A0A9C9ELT1_UNCW3|nr:hypothetical protein [candidate division WOR-3 bacterium]